MKSKRNYWLGFGAGLLLFLVLVGAVYLIYKPLGPRLKATTPTVVSTKPPATPTAIKPTESPSTPTATPVEGCRSGVMTLLLVGESVPAGDQTRGADAIQLTRVDFDRNVITLLALPSVLVVNTPALAGSGLSSAQLTRVYFEGKQMTEGSGREKSIGAMNILAQTLQTNFGYFPQHYLALNEEAFIEYVDLLGGIDIVLPAPVDGTAAGKGVFPAGAQHLTGAQAFDLVRLYVPAGEAAPNEWERFERQKLVMQAIQQAFLRPETLAIIPDMLEEFQQAVVTDLSIKDFLDLACLAKKPGLSIQFEEVGQELVTSDEAGNLLPRMDLLPQYILITVGQ
jgi:anionic cell wall polymer biosynthesis LytR-Cps2A-Psr (LCP) family protein